MATNVNRSEQALRASFATVGNLGSDPEPRYTATGTLVVTASIAEPTAEVASTDTPAPNPRRRRKAAA